MFTMTAGLRRLAFTAGAVLLAGGWGMTGYVDANQQAAGVEAGARWHEGVRATMASVQPSVPVGAMVDESSAPANAFEITRQVTPPSSVLYLLGVAAMMAGAGLMALTAPWRGGDLAAAGGRAEQLRFASPPPPPFPTAAAPPVPSFSGMPPSREAQQLAADPLRPAAQRENAKHAAKPLRYKRGA